MCVWGLLVGRVCVGLYAVCVGEEVLCMFHYTCSFTAACDVSVVECMSVCRFLAVDKYMRAHRQENPYSL